MVEANDAAEPATATAGSALAELGVVVAVGAAAALLGSAPAALRGAGAFTAWIALGARLAAPAVLAAWVLRGALTALRRRVAPASVAGGVGGAFVIAVAALSSFASVGFVLHKTTHHRPLAGTTFAVVGLVAVLGAALAAVRLAGWVRPSAARQRAFLYGGALATVAVTWVFAVALRRAGGLPPEIAASVVDVAAVGAPLVLLTVAVRRLPGRTVGGLLVGLALALCVMGRVVRTDTVHAPVHALFGP